jgi:DNA-binding NarL/FixJ family response regulator
MAVLSEPAENPPAPGDHLHVIVSAESAETHRRVARTLAHLDLEASLKRIGSPSELSPRELFELEVNPTAIVVLFCDVDLPRDMATLRRLCRELREQAIVAISPEATGTGVRRALDAGADAIVFEPELESTLAVAVSAVASGQSVVPRKLRASIERPTFSHRERQVLAFVSRGLTNAQIADKLFLSESTIKSHLSSAFAKFGVRSRKEAAALFLELEQTTGALPAGPEPVLSVGA